MHSAALHVTVCYDIIPSFKTSMQADNANFDVVIIGAGPGGGHCARLLAKAGQKVLLVERYDRFAVNSFSSAGTPLETLQQFDLPESVVGSYWREIAIVSTHRSECWRAPQPLGAVLDFARLKQFLAAEVVQAGGEVWMGHLYLKHVQQGQNTLVWLKSKQGEITVSTKVLVDATGPGRAVIYDKGEPLPDFLTGTGIEYLIQVSQADYQRLSDRLTFFLGHRWMPRGYSWIFPMEPGYLKVGAGALNVQHSLVEKVEPLKHYIQLLIDEYIQPETYQVVEVHGSTLKYSRGLNDIYHRSNVIAIGDAVSTVNFLGGEGIRHAMVSAEMAARAIQRYLKGQAAAFETYEREMHRHFDRKWFLSEKLGLKKYLIDSDDRVDKLVDYFKVLSVDDLMDVLFQYRFNRLSKIFWHRLWLKVRSLVKQ